jgi:hypothetical protein
MNQSSNPTKARAEETLSFRMITHVTSTSSHDVGDVDGHVVSLVRFSGLVFFSEGTVGTVCFAATTDYTNGVGTFTLYPIITLDDGSVLCLKSTGTGSLEGAKTQFVGTVTVLGGKGRFAGTSGDGRLTGTRYTPLSVGADLVSDYTLNIWKTS